MKTFTLSSKEPSSSCQLRKIKHVLSMLYFNNDVLRGKEKESMVKELVVRPHVESPSSPTLPQDKTRQDNFI